MNAEINHKENKKGFIPFELQISVLTIEEARLLYHMFNYKNIGKVIMKDPNYLHERKCCDFVSDTGYGIMEKIREEIHDQGFKIFEEDDKRKD